MEWSYPQANEKVVRTGRGKSEPEIVVSGQQIHIGADADIVEARMAARALGMELGFDAANLVMIATAVSEVTRNIIEYASAGELTLFALLFGSKRGLEVIAHDKGPGIADLAAAIHEGFSTSRSIGLGLPGSRRLMDEFHVDSKIGYGTTVTMKKWLT